MDTVKNFFTGLFIVVAVLVIAGLFAIAWPFILGLGSIILSIAAVILFIILVFYIITFIGFLARKLLKKK